MLYILFFFTREMEWSNEVIMEFLDLYEREEVIWNPQHGGHKDRNQVYDAWKQIQKDFSLECSLKELKKKKENLMSTFRKLNVKVKKSGKTGSATFQVYKPEWFAYEKMATFLHNVYVPRGTKTTDDQVILFCNFISLTQLKTHFPMS